MSHNLILKQTWEVLTDCWRDGFAWNSLTRSANHNFIFENLIFHKNFSWTFFVEKIVYFRKHISLMNSKNRWTFDKNDIFDQKFQITVISEKIFVCLRNNISLVNLKNLWTFEKISIDWPDFLLTGACVKFCELCSGLWKFPYLFGHTLPVRRSNIKNLFPQLVWLDLSRWSLGFELPWVKKCLAQTILNSEYSE